MTIVENLFVFTFFGIGLVVAVCNLFREPPALKTLRMVEEKANRTAKELAANFDMLIRDNEILKRELHE